MEGVRERKDKTHIGVNTAVKDLPFIPTFCLKHLSHVEPDSFERFGLRTLLHLVQNLPEKFLSVQCSKHIERFIIQNTTKIGLSHSTKKTIFT